MVAPTAAPAAATVSAGARLPARELLWLNLYWFVNSLHWGALLAVVLPSQIDKLFGNKELLFRLVVAGGTPAPSSGEQSIRAPDCCHASLIACKLAYRGLVHRFTSGVKKT